MSKNERKATVYTEDTIKRTRDGVLGVVIRTWHDIEQNEDSVTLVDGEFEVNWHDSFGFYGKRALEGEDLQINHEDDPGYVVVDRSFGIGDAVKRDSTAAMSGIVQRGETRLKIRNFATREVRECMGRDVTVETERFQVDDYIVHGEWVGTIHKSLKRRSIVQLTSGEVVVANEMIPTQYDEGGLYYPDLMPSTTLVEFDKMTLKQAQYLQGSYKKGISRHGVVLTSYTWEVPVNWHFQNPMVAKFKSTPTPDRILLLSSSPELRTAHLIDANFTHQIGDFVRPIDGPLQGGLHIPKTDQFVQKSVEEQKKTCLDWEVISTEQIVTVKWQDGKVEELRAVDLVPYQNVDDLELWPADHVVSKNNGKKGIVQTCDARERIATVLSAGAQDNKAAPQIESLYELMNDADFNIDLGDLVLIIPEDGKISDLQDTAPWGATELLKSVTDTMSRYISGLSSAAQIAIPTKTSTVDWFGQLVEVRTDGNCLVSLCFNDVPELVTVPVTRLVHVATTGYNENDSNSESSEDSDFTMDSTDSDSSAYDSDWSEDGEEEDAGQWINEDGQPLIETGDAEEWEDAEAESAEDVEMIDVVGEEVANPERADIVLDVEADAQNDANTGQSTRSDARAQSDRQPVVADRSTEVSDAALPVTVEAESLPASSSAFASFLILDSEPSDHAFVNEPLNRAPEAMKRVVQEYKSLRNSLPSGILVRAYESRMDLLRVIILGVPGTPYVYAPMLFDVYLPAEFPHQPPFVHFHSWTNGVGKINPNLYEEGKVCLSLLGTWHGTSSESWTVKSSLLQIFVSLQALVLVREPYYNEAGYDVLSASDTAVAASNYSERAFVLTRGFISHVLRNPVLGLSDELEWLYRGPPRFLQLALQQAEQVAVVSNGTVEPASESTASVTRVSKGALVLLNRIIKELQDLTTTA